jgi:hypothetical protein
LETSLVTMSVCLSVCLCLSVCVCSCGRACVCVSVRISTHTPACTLPSLRHGTIPWKLPWSRHPTVRVLEGVYPFVCSCVGLLVCVYVSPCEHTHTCVYLTFFASWNHSMETSMLTMACLSPSACVLFVFVCAYLCLYLCVCVCVCVCASSN